MKLSTCRQSADGSVSVAKIAGMNSAHSWHTMLVRVSRSNWECALLLPISAFIATNPEPPTLVSECDFFVQFWRTRKGPNQFADAMRDAE